ncbi:MAG: alginate lyase family protein [Chitinophagaceae bacterium]|nr:alginate lyase family protein [Chitinophagaceae bacterium]
MLKQFKTISLAAFLAPFCIFCSGQKNNALPFILQNESRLSAFKVAYENGDTTAKKEITALMNEADKTLTSGPYSVTFKKLKTPPSGNIHDYMSQAPYWWADSSKPDGLPYIRKDGRINPERNLSKDYSQMGQMNGDVKQLALAYYFTGNDKYVAKAIQLLRVWFLDTATRMNPNLNYGQFIPGLTDGRGIGIIETAGLTNIPDALAMMQTSKLLTAQFTNKIKDWYRQYANWLINSKNGKDELAATNNHGTYYDMQLADFALFTGNTELAKKVIMEQTFPRIDQQFTVEGAEPLELVRTKSWGYSTMNLVGWSKLAVIADHLNIDLWHKQTIDGKGIQKVLEWFQPYMLKQKAWKYEQIEPITYNNILSVYNLASSKYPGAFNNVLQFYPSLKSQNPWW